jgi:ppGpp synthetase/RelA/SpoT-type nucleotidyltranferase
MNLQSKSSIDQLGETLKQTPVSRETLIALDQYRLSFHTAIAQVRNALNEQCGVQCTLRPSKSTPSIIAKLIRQPSTRLTQIQDIAGLRVIVKDYIEQNRLRDKVIALFPSCKIYDRREKPSFGYRAVHLVMKIEERLVELQIRTEFQHAWGQVSEKFADIVGHHTKYEFFDNPLTNNLSALSNVVHGLEILTEVDSTILEVSNSEIEEYKLETLQMLNATLIGLEQYKKTK